jgi:asparagine synthase (glutamine-hydrolysing)
VSGIVGIVNVNKAPVDPVLLREVTQHMAYRGPDAQQTWIDTYVGLGHAMLRTTFEMAEDQQPRTLDGRVWITADARIDAREELIHKLKANAPTELAHVTDTDLILHAYRVWGLDCIRHLLGDFAFAIWDTSRQRLFCARDHFGVRPFYYAKVNRCLIFSNNLETIRRHPLVSDELNDLAIVNFLLFRYQPRIDQTSFKDIQALRPAHTLTWEGGTTTISRYWTLPIEAPIRYKRHHDYVDHFRELFDTAVADRMRTNRAGILMSGGMDSSSVAATIHSLRLKKKEEFALRAFTYVYDQLIPDEERHYATLVARYLDIPIHLAVMDDERWFGGWDREGFRFPEPMVTDPLWNDDNCVRKAALYDDVRVFYCGFGPDSMLSEPTRYGMLLREGRIGDFLGQIVNFVVRYHQQPATAAKRFWQRLQGPVLERRADADALALLAPSIVERIDVPKRWRQLPNDSQRHPWRPSTYSQVTDYYWSLWFQRYDAANWYAPVEFRYPYFDTRLVQYLLRVPVLPEFSNKALLRKAMHGKLPEAVRIRPKAPLAGKPNHSYAEWVHRNSRPSPQLALYVNTNHVVRLFSKLKKSEEALEHRLIALNHWLQRYKQQQIGCEPQR